MADSAESQDHSESEQSQTPVDRRLYLTDTEHWTAAVKQGTDRQYCFVQNPGEGFFHLILDGEIFVRSGDEQVCLNCALRRGLVTTDRLFWQHRPKTPSPRV
ncbi:MAG: hypothetical protein KDA52_05270 [Planctomycetaceae bacterium]|nr:hypothetical protein [Planctomycetaceae bacterium]